MSLTETAFYTRRAINWGVLGVIGYILLRIIISIMLVIFGILFPPKAIPPNNAFGKLPALLFPAQATGSAVLTYQLETITGDVPAASASANVFLMPKVSPNLLALNSAQDFAKQLEFNPNPIQESKNIYRFNDPDLPLRRLRFDIVSGNFILRYAFEQDPSVFSEKNTSSADKLTSEASSWLSSYDLYQKDLEKGTSSVTFLRLNGANLVPTSSLSQADAIRVDFFRSEIGEMKIFTPNPDEASVSIVFSGSSDRKKHILQVAYTYWPIDTSTAATYGLKTSSQAWTELQSGLGYIARYPTGGNTAIIRNVSLGYYDTYDPQTYLQPIFVFEGDNGFLGYVPAIAPPWTE